MKKKKMCVSGYPTYPNFSQRRLSFYWHSKKKKLYHTQSTLFAAIFIGFATFAVILEAVLLFKHLLYPPQTVFVGGYTVFTLSDRTNDRPTERVSVTFCFHNNFKNH